MFKFDPMAVYQAGGVDAPGGGQANTQLGGAGGNAGGTDVKGAFDYAINKAKNLRVITVKGQADVNYAKAKPRQ